MQLKNVVNDLFSFALRSPAIPRCSEPSNRCAGPPLPQGDPPPPPPPTSGGGRGRPTGGRAPSRREARHRGSRGWRRPPCDGPPGDGIGPLRVRVLVPREEREGPLFRHGERSIRRDWSIPRKTRSRPRPFRARAVHPRRAIDRDRRGTERSHSVCRAGALRAGRRGPHGREPRRGAHPLHRRHSAASGVSSAGRVAGRGPVKPPGRSPTQGPRRRKSGWRESANQQPGGPVFRPAPPASYGFGNLPCTPST